MDNQKLMRKACLGIVLLILCQLGISETKTSSMTQDKQANTYGATYVNAMGVPLNRYGAVASSAKVPLSVQVPPAPANLHLPQITPATTIWQSEQVPAPFFSIYSYLVIDAKSGNVIAAENANKRVAPASLTKMMLLYIVEKYLARGSIKLDEVVRVPSIAWHTSGSEMHLKSGQQVSIEQLIKGAIVASGNDAAVTLAIQVAGTQANFVRMMNIEAKRLHMTNTHFSDVMGLPAPNLYTSAHDLGILARHLVYDYPQYYHFFKTKTVSMNGFHTANYNLLLKIYPYADGIKTGSTDEAGYSLVASAVKPKHRRLISVVLGAQSLVSSARISQSLLEYAFANFKTKTFYKDGQVLGNIVVYKGKRETVSIGVSKEISISYPSLVQASQLSFILRKSASSLVAPVNIGQKVGQLEVFYNGREIQQFPVVALQSDPLGSLWQRIKGTFAALG